MTILKTLSYAATAGLLTASAAMAAPIVYEGSIAPGTTVSGTVDGSVCGVCGEGTAGTLDFWSFSGTAGDSITITGTRVDVNFDHSFGLYFGTTSADDSLTAGHAFYGSDFDTMSFLAFADDQISHAGPFGDPLLSGFSLAQTGIYTIVVGAASGQTAPNSAYQLTLEGPTPAAVPLPAGLALLLGGLGGLGILRRKKSAAV